MNRRLLGIAAAVALAAVGTYVLVIWVQSAEDRALAGEETVEVLVVREDIAQGTNASAIGEQLDTERVPAKVQASGAVANLDDLEGQVAAVDLVPGEQIVAARFTDPATLARQGEVDFPEDLQEVTISLDPIRALGGELLPGDMVGVFSSFDPFDVDNVVVEGEAGEELAEIEASQTPNTTHLILNKVLVTNVQGDPTPTPDSDDEEEGDSGAGRNPAPGGNILVTLAVNSPDAERVVFTAEFGHLWLSKQTDTTDEDGTRIQDRGTIYEQ